MAKLLLLVAAVFSACVAASNGCSTEALTKCEKPTKDNMCGPSKKYIKCVKDAKCDSSIPAFSIMVDTIEKMCKDCTFPLVNCENKKECEFYSCIMKVKKGCKGQFEMAMTGKTENFDKLKEKCGCGSLQSSLLMVLASAVLVFLRSQF